ncbi:MAG: MFS transporter [Acidobacteriaceae bacterium]|nr:MFS transporter [Acidobacteriaceae bacterium]
MRRLYEVRLSLILIAASFFLWGILRSLDDLLVALFQAAGTLRYATAMQIHASFFSAYLVASIPAGYLLRRNGYRRLLVCSVMLMALGSAICAPALWTNSFQLCLIGVFIVALGIAVLQTTSNPCIGLLGPEHSATARLLLVQAFVTLGSALGPLTSLALFGGWTRSTQSAPLEAVMNLDRVSGPSWQA